MKKCSNSLRIRKYKLKWDIIKWQKLEMWTIPGAGVLGNTMPMWCKLIHPFNNLTILIPQCHWKHLKNCIASSGKESTNTESTNIESVSQRNSETHP